MIARLIHWSVHNRFLVLLATLGLLVGGLVSLRQTPVDALPDLSDVQVIVRTSLPGQAPQIVENQVTYPLSTTLLSVPGAKAVRAYSFFGDSFVYVLFEDGTDGLDLPARQHDAGLVLFLDAVVVSGAAVFGDEGHAMQCEGRQRRRKRHFYNGCIL